MKRIARARALRLSGVFLFNLELPAACGLCAAIKWQLAVCGSPGWLDVQMLMSALSPEAWSHGPLSVVDVGVAWSLSRCRGRGRPGSGACVHSARLGAVAVVVACERCVFGFLQGQRRERSATLDMDVALIESHKRQALHSYKGYKAYQPLNCWWAEQV